MTKSHTNEKHEFILEADSSIVFLGNSNVGRLVEELVLTVHRPIPTKQQDRKHLQRTVICLHLIYSKADTHPDVHKLLSYYKHENNPFI